MFRNPIGGCQVASRVGSGSEIAYSRPGPTGRPREGGVTLALKELVTRDILGLVGA